MEREETELLGKDTDDWQFYHYKVRKKTKYLNTVFFFFVVFKCSWGEGHIEKNIFKIYKSAKR